MNGYRQFAAPVFFVGGFLVLVLHGAYLRFDRLGEHPFHADEAATGAQTLAYRLESSVYRFDPRHGHGPMLTALAEPWCRLQGQRDWGSLEVRALREITAASGLLASLGLFALGAGWARALCGAAFATTSPLLVYYSRHFIHEPVFLLFSVPALAGLFLLLRNRRPWLGAALFGFGSGAMAATRETVVIALFAWTVAGLLFLWRQARPEPTGRTHLGTLRFFGDEFVRRGKPLLLATLIFLFVVFWFYSSGGREPAGFFAFFSTYLTYETGEGHDKPLDYYLDLLLYPKDRVARWWSEAGVFLIALCVYLDRSRRDSAAAGRFLFEAGMLCLLVFSLFSYKTPWLASLGWLQMTFAAGCGAVALARRLPRRTAWVSGLVLIAVVAWQSLQARRASIRLAADARNPYAYVPTSRDVTGLGNWLNDLRQALPATLDDPIAVVGAEYWPLPWYLRDSGSVGFWPGLEPEIAALPVLLVMPTVFDEVAPALEDSHTFIPRGLRHEFPLMMAIRNDLWNAYQER